MDISSRSITSPAAGGGADDVVSSSSSLFRRMKAFATGSSDKTATDDTVRKALSDGIAGDMKRVLGLDYSSPEDIDMQLRSLYQEPGALEKRCILVASGLDEDADEKLTISGKEAELQQGRKITSYFFSDKTPQSVIANLPDAFFSPDFDAAAQLPLEVASWGKGDLTDKFMTKMEDFDTDKDMILSSLADLIEANYGEIVECMRDINAIDFELSQAASKTIACREKLAVASAALCAGPVMVASMQAKRDRLALVADTVRSIKALIDVHKAVQNDLTINALARAAEGASSLLFSLQNNSYGYGQFKSLSNLKVVVRKNFVTVRQKTDKALQRMCSRKFAAAEYADIVKGYLILDHAAETLGLPLGVAAAPGTAGADGDIFDQLGCMEGLDRRVLRFLTDDIDSCRHAALLELIYASQHRKQKAASSIDIAGVQVYMHMSTLEMVDLAEMAMDELHRLVAAEMVAQCVMKTCSLLADVVHTHYLLTQWHRAPFDPRNEDPSYLHRFGPTDSSDPAPFGSPLRREAETDPAEPSPKGLKAETTLGSETKDRPKKISSKLSSMFKMSKSSPQARSVAEGKSAVQTASSDTSAAQRVRNADSMRGVIARAFEHNWKRPHSQALSSLARTGKATQTSPTSRSKSQSQSQLRSQSRSLFDSDADNDLENTVEAADDADGLMLGTDDRKLTRLRGARMAVVYERLLLDRASLWSLIAAALADMLHNLALPVAVPFDDFLAVLWAVSTMVNLGREFCAAESQGLLDTLHGKAREYLQNTHAESFQVLRQMVESEAWRGVPVALDEMGGVLGVIRKSMPPLRKARAASGSSSSSNISSCYDNKSSSILASFVSCGNPFHFSEPDEEQPSDEESHVHMPATTVPSSLSLVSSLAVEYECFVEMLAKEEGKGSVGTVCVTQTLLHGLARYAGRYLQMMHLLPSTAPEVFSSLCQLFDYYLCAVYRGFVGLEERQWLAHRFSRLSSSPPERSEEFEVVCSYMERIQSETVLLSQAHYLHLMEVVGVQAQEHQDARDKLQWDSANNSRRLSQIATAMASSMSAAAAVAEAAALSAASTSMTFAHEATSALASAGTVGDSLTTGSTSTFSGSGNSSGSGTASSTCGPADSTTTENSPLGSCPGFVAEGTGTVAVPLSTVLSVAVPECIRFRGTDQRSFYAMCERIVAAESCTFAAMILVEIKPKLERLTAVWDEGVTSPHVCDAYIARYQAAVRQLQTLLYRSMCPQLIQREAVLVKMGDSSRCRWDAKQLRQTPHEWVFDLAESCREAWSYMNQQSSLGAGTGIAITDAVKEQVWSEMCRAAFDTALEGFSRAKRCSPEGRASMLMDVAELQKGLEEIHHLCPVAEDCAESRWRGGWGGRDHVVNFVHATHMPEEDLILWVNEHWRRYAYRHTIGLLNMTLAGQSGLMPMSGSGAKRLKDAVAHVDGLYDQLLVSPTSAPLGSSSVDKAEGQQVPPPPPPPASAPVDTMSMPAPPGAEKSKEKLSRRIAKSLGIRSSNAATTD